MEKILNVVVPVDFTPVSLKAFEFLNFLMQKISVRTHLLHVIQVNAADWAGTSEASETINREEIRALEDQANHKFSELKQHVDFSFSSEILHGGLTTTIAGYASKHHVDLVIMGTEGADGWYERISGSEAQHVVRYTDVPVITVHQHASITPVHNMLWVADFEADKQPEQSIATIKMIQQIFSAQLHLLQIIQKEDEPNVQDIKESMQRFADKLQLKNYELHLHHDYKVPSGVRNFNQTTEMDLVVVGTHARKGFSHIFNGSIAETLVNHCIRPLLTYHIK